MIEVAERMTARYCEGDSLKVAAYQRRNLTCIEQGLQVWDEWTDYVEPVRTRRYLSRNSAGCGRRFEDRHVSPREAIPD